MTLLRLATLFLCLKVLPSHTQSLSATALPPLCGYKGWQLHRMRSPTTTPTQQVPKRPYPLLISCRAAILVACPQCGGRPSLAMSARAQPVASGREFAHVTGVLTTAGAGGAISLDVEPWCAEPAGVCGLASSGVRGSGAMSRNHQRWPGARVAGLCATMPQAIV